MALSELSEDESILKLLRRVSETPPVSEVRRPVRPGQSIASGRFQILEDLGSGGMGRVLAASDRDGGDRHVALKFVGRVTPQAILHLKREFRTASELVHPNIIRLNELFRDGAEWFFTMELVRGVHLPELLGSTSGNARWDLIRTVARQLALALQAVHDFGAVHGDLKPSNFLIEAGDSPRVVLLDFGLTRSLGDAACGGTVAYMAPEQIDGGPVTEVTDWYSFGLVLYESLTGDMPAKGVSPSDLQQFPSDLRELCLGLLEIDPARRKTGTAVFEALGFGSAKKRESTAPRRPRLVGRARELAVVESWRANAPTDSPALLFVQGPSGIGKTAFVEHLLQAERARGALVLRCRCRENESIGYKAIDGLVDDLVAILSDMSVQDAACVLPTSEPALLHLFPALRACFSSAERVRAEDRGDQNLIRQRGIVAFVELLRRLSVFGRLVIWIDDLQWSDTESALILGPLLGGAEPLPVLFIGSYRKDHGGSIPVVDALYSDRALLLPRATELNLGPLDESDAQALALSLLPTGADQPRAQAQTIVRDAAGLPLFISELAHLTGEGWAESSSEPVTLTSVIVRRVNSLPPLAKQMIELVALAGNAVSRATLKQAQRFETADLDDAIGVLRAARLIVTSGPREEHLVDMRHDRLRELVSRSIDDARRQQCHLSLASVFEAAGGKPEEIATHYQSAGDLIRAAWHWLAAAEESAKALAFKKAAEFYERALRRASLDSTERNEVRLKRAQMLAYAGEGQLAAEVYLSTALESSREVAIELRRRAAEQLLLSGRIEHGMQVMGDVLAATRLRLAPPGKRAIPSLILGRIRVRLRGLRYRVRGEAELSTEELARLDVAWTMACSMGFVDYIRGADFQNRHLLLALQAGEPRRLGRALALEALNAAAPGRGARRRTEILLQTSESLVEQTPDRDWALGLVSLARGVSAYLHCETKEAVIHCGSAVDTLTTRCAGAIWERVTAQRFLIASLFHAGEFARLNAIVPPLLAEAEVTANLYARQFFRSGYSIAAWLVRDEVDEARRQLALAGEEWRSATYQLPEYNRLISQTYIDLYAGEVERASATIREHWPTIQEAQLLRIGIVRVQLWQLRGATALAAATELTRRGDTTAAIRARADARYCATKLSTDSSPRARPFAALLAAACDAGDGAKASARRNLELAADAFERQGMSLFAASARYRLGSLGGASADAVVKESRGQVAAQGVTRPEKMLRMLAPGFLEA